MDWEASTQAINSLVRDTFGVTATYTPTVGPPVQIKGVFTKEFISVKVGDVIGNSSVHPMLAIKLSDLALKPARGDKATINGTNYLIIESQEDGGGGSNLILNSA